MDKQIRVGSGKTYSALLMSEQLRREYPKIIIVVKKPTK